MSGLELQNFQVSVGGKIAKLDVRIAPSERLVLRGASGSGKTTLLRAIAGVQGDDVRVEGRILLEGIEISKLPAEKRGLGWVPQEPTLFPSLDVLGNVTFSLRMRGVARAERETLGLAALSEVGLADRAFAPVHLLSGGEAQRVSFLRAVLGRPRALLLDEPFSALDASLRRDLQDWVVAWQEREKIPFIFVTHDPSEAGRVGTLEVSIG